MTYNDGDGLMFNIVTIINNKVYMYFRSLTCEFIFYKSLTNKRVSKSP